MDVHVEDEAKITSTKTDNIEDAVCLKSNEETSIDLKFQHLEQENSVGDIGTQYKGTNNHISVSGILVWRMFILQGLIMPFFGITRYSKFERF